MVTEHEQRIRESSARIREYDKKRRQSPHRAGKTMPDLDDLQIGGSRVFQLAVLSVDIRGFTKLSLSLGKEVANLARLQSLYLAEMSAIIRDRNGVTEKYTGDGVLGLFGTEADTTGATDALSAVCAALDIQMILDRSLNPYFKQLGLPEIACGQGIDYGLVLMERVGLRGDNQFSLAGPTVSLAAKLQGVAQGGQIMVGRDVFSRLPEGWRKFCKGPVQWEFNNPAYHFEAHW